MANRDQVNERYYGQINSEESHEATRHRIHWICCHVQGRTVLDVGCSQGITSILLGREGFEVTAIDLEEDSISYAKRELRQESATVRGRVHFQLKDISQFERPPGGFDTIILGEILEHFAHPHTLLAHVYRLLNKKGSLVLSVPYGYHPFHDHKRTYYAGSLSRVLYPYFDEKALEVHHKYLCFAGRKKSKEMREVQPGTEHLARWMKLDEEQFRLVEQQHARKMNQRKAALDKAVQRTRQMEEHFFSLEGHARVEQIGKVQP
ncbi:class I SAM-dependent methyltransferase [Paenibacillus brasilensis]|uniref:2-polyprenyl-6-hydroxyphenyl methylase/3-demethylubiquinone-9 3-methyltransferase n=1 Tax=Paenibacillus brasilensis TaxID=128574 RepID=A0ABU0L2T2_9BACL|nr:methyltransferase domain-containing protein [Paenibacillus brasilensis]MDQ0495475.1 2-polyprenyl-6-hydroxyphenyl methylase/3-demethylubiquinone-9 3-methyltransferase [Paenibacillus brasilensis]